MISYRDILQQQLNKRVELNSRYSMRAFAKFIGMPASNLSEVLHEKKGISLGKANELCEKLKLNGKRKQIFILSVLALHSRSSRDKINASNKLEELFKSSNENKTRQRNAWYFGAVKALRDAGITTKKKLSKILFITELQAENASRYLNRIKKFYPERTEIKYEKSSILKKMQESYLSNEENIKFDNYFLLLSKDELKKLGQRMENFLKNDETQSADKDLYMITITKTKLTEGESNAS